MRHYFPKAIVSNQRSVAMKKLLMVTTLLASSTLANISYAGCSEWGTVNYVYRSTTGLLAIINGTACFVNSGDLTAAASVLSVAKANGLQGYLTQSGESAIQYN